MTIWAFKGPSNDDYDQEEYQEVTKFLTASIHNGISRFGWGYMDEADLNKLKPKLFSEMSEKEKECWAKANFLLDVAVGDWIVHINLPYWGACLAGQVTEPYSFEQDDNEISDFRHMIKLDPSSVVEFERNDDEVLPIISSRLKLQGRYWRIQNVEEFLQTIENINAESLGKTADESVGVFYLKKDLSPLLKLVTDKIQKSHPASHLESLIAEIFRKIPRVVDVRENGKHKGWGSDSGADLIVTYKSGLALSNLEKEEKLVVQVKSYVGQHWETNAVTQTETAISEYEANAGLIITTAERTKDLEEAIEELSTRLKKPVGLIAGEDVAKFVLKYGGELVL